VHFRQWATRTLREHLVQGYTLNAQRLAEKGLAEARAAFDLLTQTLTGQALVSDEGIAVLGIVRRYLASFGWLLAYDENRLPTEPVVPVKPQALSLKEAREAIGCLREELSRQGVTTALFGQEYGEGLPAILGNIEQTFGGEPLYPSAQTRAAHLLYFVIKDHPFSDGNKRIGALLFLNYLRRNGLLFRPNGVARFANNAVVALTLLIAESAPSQKELLIRLVLTLLGDDVA
jgi:prophage maintenance system killer protein